MSERTIRRPWTVDFVGTTKVRCYPHSPISSAVIYYTLPDHEEMSFLAAFVETGDLFVDVGANIGLYALVAASVEGVRVMAFEPGDATRSRLHENVTLNGFDNRIDVRSAAVGSSPGTMRFTTQRGPMNRLLEPDEVPAEPVATVDVVTIDEVLRSVDTPIPAMKIDVEGFEIPALDGARAIIGAHHPALLTEVNDVDGLGAAFSELGYTPVTFDVGRRRVQTVDLASRFRHNVIAVHDLAATQDRLDRIAAGPPRRLT